jgi:predicted nucleic acid-binding protein
MSKLKIYLDTSVISCLEQTNKPDDRRDCEKLFAKIKAGEYAVYVSEVTRNELANAKEPLRPPC